MPDADDLVHEVAEAIADRTPVDWAAVRPRLGAAAEERLYGALRSIDLVATQGGGPSTLASRPGRGPLPAWIRAAVAACGAAVLLGALGTVVGTPDSNAIPVALLIATAWIYAAMGAWLLAASRDDRGAMLGAWFLSLAASVSYRPMHWLVPLLPAGSAFRALLSLWVPEVLLPVFLALFVGGFPRVPRWSAADRASTLVTRLAWAAALCCALGHALATYASPSSPESSPTLGWMARTHIGQAYWVVLLAPAALALGLLVARWQRAEGEEGRRGSLFVAGLALGLAPAIAVIVLSATIPAVGRLLDDPARLRLVAFVTYGFVLSIPFTTAYAIRAHHVFTVRFVVRGAARRLLARSSLALLTLVPAALLVGHLIRNQHQSLAMLFSGRQALLSLALTALGLLGIAAHAPLARALDRVLRPRRGDARASLFRAHQNLRCARSAEEALDVLLREIETTLGGAGGVLFAASDAYVSRDGRLPALPAEAALVQLAVSAEGPLLVDPASARSVFRLLPEAERTLVGEAGVALVLPVPGNPRPRALLLLEPARDGDPYSPEDFLYLGALGTAGGLALDSVGTARRDGTAIAGSAEAPAAECGACGLVHAAGSTACTCGSELRPALLPAVLNGKFRLARRLGGGAMGVVYEAEDLELARPVALKTLPRVSPELALRLRREARTMARLLHPRLATIFGCEEWRGVPVLVMERLAGTLADRLGRPRELREVLEVGVAAAEGLAVMHDHGLLHRDVKPSNVGLACDGAVKLLDFGIAHLLTSASDPTSVDGAPSGGRGITAGEMDLTSRVVGTPLYCSRERLEGAAATAADDVWSLAMVLYELLAGQHPWRGSASVAAPVPVAGLDEARPSCPPAVARFFARALSAQAAERPATARELRAGLALLIEDEPDRYIASA